MSDSTEENMPSEKVISETTKGQQRVLFSLTMQGWVQWGTVLIVLAGAYYKVVGSTEINSLRITNVEHTVTQIQADRDRDATRYESMLKDANVKLDNMSKDLNKLIGRIEISDRAPLDVNK